MLEHHADDRERSGTISQDRMSGQDKTELINFDPIQSLFLGGFFYGFIGPIEKPASIDVNLKVDSLPWQQKVTLIIPEPNLYTSARTTFIWMRELWCFVFLFFNFFSFKSRQEIKWNKKQNKGGNLCRLV